MERVIFESFLQTFKPATSGPLLLHKMEVGRGKCAVWLEWEVSRGTVTHLNVYCSVCIEKSQCAAQNMQCAVCKVQRTVCCVKFYCYKKLCVLGIAPCAVFRKVIVCCYESIVLLLGSVNVTKVEFTNYISD